jgi:hypothetical protein
VSRGGDWIHPPTRYAIVWFRDGGRCLACGWRPERRFGAGLVLDHVVPASRWGALDGAHAPANLATLCKDCNEAKGDRAPWEIADDLRWTRIYYRCWARPLKRWHRVRGYNAAVRTGRYRRAYNVAKCARYAPTKRIDREHERALREHGRG